MFNAYKRFFAFAGKQKKTWYKGMGYELLRSIFEAIQFIALLVVLRALVEQNVTGETALAALGVMLVSVTGAAVFWYLAHNSEGQANYHMCEEKRIRIGERMKYMPMGYFNSQSLEPYGCSNFYNGRFGEYVVCRHCPNDGRDHPYCCIFYCDSVF